MSYLAKVLEFARRFFARLVELGRWIIGLLRSIEIDRPRGVLLSVALQVVVLLLLIALAPSSGAAKPSQASASGSSEQPAPNAAGDAMNPQ